jgi:hypothetical protein
LASKAGSTSCLFRKPIHPSTCACQCRSEWRAACRAILAPSGDGLNHRKASTSTASPNWNWVGSSLIYQPTAFLDSTCVPNLATVWYFVLAAQRKLRLSDDDLLLLHCRLVDVICAADHSRGSLSLHSFACAHGDASSWPWCTEVLYYRAALKPARGMAGDVASPD